MIISLRGTNGAGKSTLVRKIMKLYDVEHHAYEEGRKKPLSTLLRRNSSFAFELMVPGHYEIANGGVDTLPSLDKAYTMIELAHETGVHVLYEGKNMSDGPQRLIEMHEKGWPVAAVIIKITNGEAEKSVRKRGHKIKLGTIVSLNDKMTRQVETFRKAGVPVWHLSRASALKKVKELLELKP